MTKEEIQQATFKDLSNRFSYLYNHNLYLLCLVYGNCFNEPKLFSCKEIKDFKNRIEENRKEMNLIAKYRPKCAIVITDYTREIIK